ncbi:MAG: hypothetical protein JWN04_3374 [Myxococcaceae bacterium]|nr:hypothetical protein [Myxococcaceae bacterium]
MSAPADRGLRAACLQPLAPEHDPCVRLWRTPDKVFYYAVDYLDGASLLMRLSWLSHPYILLQRNWRACSLATRHKREILTIPSVENGLTDRWSTARTD